MGRNGVGIMTEKDEHELKFDARRAALQQIKNVLLSHNIKISLESCGCCSGVSMKFQYGEEVMYDDGEAEVDMFSSPDPNDKY